MKKFVITENEKRNILGMYGLINEQSSTFQIPQEIFQIITDIEARFSYCSGGEVYGESSYKGNSKLGVFTNYVKNTIGFDTWNKLDDNTKAQIYSFAYQSDSGDGGFKYRWIKGLAQAIDPNFDRVNGDPNESIKIIQSAKNLGAIYDDYKKVVKDQYNNITLKNDTDCNRKKVWGPRPDAVERMMGGEDHKAVLDEWEKTYIKKVTNQTANKPSNQKEEVINGQNINKLRENLKLNSPNKKFDPNSVTIDMKSKTVTFKPGDITLKSLSLIFDPNQDVLNQRWNNIKSSQENKITSIKDGFDDQGKVYWRLSYIPV